MYIVRGAIIGADVFEMLENSDFMTINDETDHIKIRSGDADSIPATTGTRSVKNTI